MSTRAAIALPAPDGWWGRYHHCDGYPTRLGRELFGLYHHTFDRDHREMATVLIDEHPAGWSCILADSEGPYTRPHFEQAGFTALDSPARGHYPECYCHGTRNESEGRLVCCCPTDATGCAPAFIEWAYVLTPSGMNVLTSWHPAPDQHLFAHRPIAHVAWQQDQPDWNAIEGRARYTKTHPGQS